MATNHASGLLRSSAEVVQAARAEEWCKVRDVLVGHPDLRVTLEPRHQREVKEDAMTKGAWSFIYDLVVDRFYFAPRTLDFVVLTAVRKRYFHFAESVTLKTMKIYTFDEIVLYEVFRAFCSLDLWIPNLCRLMLFFPFRRNFQNAVMILYNDTSVCERLQSLMKETAFLVVRIGEMYIADKTGSGQIRQ
ncbi:hypothetical protein ACOMHN_066981 [Nucella lapillus]